MADGKFICYSFYVPDNDMQLQQFIDSQGNLSLTVRLLIKAFLANNGGMDPEKIDVGVMDLGSLIRSMQARPDIMEPMRSRGSRRGEPKAPAVARPEGPVRQELAHEEQPAPAAEIKQEPVPAPETRQEAKPDLGLAPVQDHTPEPDPDTAPESSEPAPHVTREAPAQQPAAQPAGKRPMTREEYNKSMTAGMEPVDDIAAMMGEM